jgi:hypothetical protein
MRKAAVLICAGAVIASAPAFADTHYMLCFGGGRQALYFSTVFPVPDSAKSKDEEPLFAAYVQANYGTRPGVECHRDQTEASADADKKSREESFRSGTPPYNIVETGWAGK